jgi:hypothetical protein
VSETLTARRGGTGRPQQAGRGVSGLRRQALAASAALTLEYVLGMGVNLYVTVPAADRGSGIGQAIGRAITHGPAALAIHAVIGLLLIVAALAALARAVRARHRLAAIAAAIALLCLAGASASGASFVGNGKAGASMAMAVLAGAALLCYLVILFVVPRIQPRDATPPAAPGTAAEGN